MNITDYINGSKSNSFVNWFVVEAMVNPNVVDKVVAISVSSESKNNYDLKMTLNGVELNPLASLELLHKQLQDMIDKKAEEKVNHKFHDAELQMKEAINQFAQNLGVDLNKDNY